MGSQHPVALIAIGVLLVAEYILLSVLFDARALAESSGWAGSIGALGWIGPLILIVPTAALILQRERLAKAWHEAAAAPRSRTQTAIFIVAHLSVYGALLVVTDRLVATSHPTAMLGLSWAALVLLWLVLAVFVAAAPRVCLHFLAAAAVPLAIGVTVGVAAWAAGLATEALYEPLSDYTLRAAYAVLSTVADDAFIEPDALVLGTDRFYVEVAPSCSGYEGVGLVTVFLAAFLWLSRSSLRFPQALALVPLAIAAVWLLNAVRLATLVLIGDRISPEIAAAGFHSKAGWLAVCGVTLVAVFAARRSRFFSGSSEPRAATTNPTATYLVPLLALLAAALVTGALVSSTYDSLYGVRIAAALLAIWVVARGHIERIPGYRPSLQPIVLGALAFAIWIALEPADSGAGTELRANLDTHSAAGILWIVTRCVGSVLVVPLVEELAFRGYALRRLVSVDFSAVNARQFSLLAFLVSSLAFGLLHQRWLAGTLVGMLYALAVYRRGKLTDAVIAHGVTNALVALWVLAFGHWQLWT